MSETGTSFTVQPATIDQMAGAIALTLGALGSLLLVIWQSRCICRCRIGVSDKCYLWDCVREPPPLDPDADEETSDKPGEQQKKKKKKLKPADTQPEPEPEPEPEPTLIP